MFKTPFRFSLIVLIAGLLILGSVPQSARAAAPANIRIYVGLGTGTDDQQRKDEETLIKQWNDKNPDIQVQFEYQDNATARDVLLTQIAGGNAPDIVGPVGIGGLNQTGDLWADLSRYIAQDRASLKQDDFEAATLKLYQLNGKDIAIPLGIYPSFIYADKDLFDQAQMPLPP